MSFLTDLEAAPQVNENIVGSAGEINETDGMDDAKQHLRVNIFRLNKVTKKKLKCKRTWINDETHMVNG